MDRRGIKHSKRGDDVLRDADTIRRKALERPGIREVMRVYEDWKRVDQGMDSYRTATRWVPVTRNRANADDR